jgi:ABC-type multidrug transport system ATPase subunit
MGNIEFGDSYYMREKESSLIREDKQKGFLSSYHGSYLYRLREVNVYYDQMSALKNINLDIIPHDFIFLTGPSGAGKTTLLKVLAGLINVNSGRIEGPLSLTKKNGGKEFISLVFQDLKLIEDMSIEDNLWITYDPEIYKDKNKFYHDIKEYGSYFGLISKLKNKVQDTNGGTKQKVAVVRALLSRPQILLADEPSSSLDKESTMRLYDLLSYMNRQHKTTIVWATHNSDLVKQFRSKIVHIDAGKMVYSGHACFI